MVKYVKGKAFRNGKLISKNDVIQDGDHIKTGGNGLLIIKAGPKKASTVKIGPNSDMIVKSESDSKKARNIMERYNLNIGSLMIHLKNNKEIKKHLKITTPHSSFSIRGTTFIVMTHPRKGSLLAVKEGSVRDETLKRDIQAGEVSVALDKDNSKVYKNQKFIGNENWLLDPSKGSLDFSTKAEVLWQKLISKLPVGTTQCNKALDCETMSLTLLKAGKEKEARAPLKKGCALGSKTSCIWLGRILVDIDSNPAGLHILRESCENNNAYGCYTLWEMEHSRGNKSKAREYYKKGLATFHKLKDFDQALMAFEGECQKKMASSCTRAGLLREDNREPKKAQALYEIGCDAGEGQACSNLGLIWQKKGDLKKAKGLYEKSCGLNIPIGCYNVACIHSLEKNSSKAFEYLKRSLDKGLIRKALIRSDSDLKFFRNQKEYQTLKANYQL